MGLVLLEPDDLDAPRVARGEELVRVDVAEPADEVRLGVVLRRAVDRGPSGVHRAAGVVAALEQEHGDLILLMRGIKQVFDPLGIMNPGKVLREVAL